MKTFSRKKTFSQRKAAAAKLTEFESSVYRAAKKIPRGKVSTYSEIAKAIGKPGATRAVGNALNKNPFASVPCHRVVKSTGRVGGFAHGSRLKKTMLSCEGIEFISGKVKGFEKRLYKFS